MPFSCERRPTYASRSPPFVAVSWTFADTAIGAALNENDREKNMAANPELESLGLGELEALAKEIEKAIKRRQAENLVKAREAAEAAARQHGFSLEEVVGSRSSLRSAPSSAARFRNPDNVAQTWTGRGRQPQWFKNALMSGRTPDELAAT
jgi:DNA-binding protein H-NS